MPDPPPTDHAPRPKGLSCPACQGQLRVTATRKPQAGLRTRYFACTACGRTAKSREKLVAKADDAPN